MQGSSHEEIVVNRNLIHKKIWIVSLDYEKKVSNIKVTQEITSSVWRNKITNISHDV